MATTVNLSPELMANLQELAQSKEVSIDEVAEGILNYHIQDWLDQEKEIYVPDPEELAELLETVAEYEADRAAGRMVTQEEMDQMLVDLIAEHEQKKASTNASK